MPRSLAALFLLASVLVGCDDGRSSDRTEDDCGLLVSMEVEVLDAAGAPVSGATVTARHLESEQAITGVTGEDGVTRAINERLGAGTLEVSAIGGTKVSDTQQVTWACDACRCTPQPERLTLRLRP